MAMHRLTRRYARALYEQAAERHEQQAVYRQLCNMADALAAEPRLLTLLKHPSLAEERKVDALLTVAVIGQAREEPASIKPFLRLILRKGRVVLLRRMPDAFRDIWDEDRGILRAHVTSARQSTPEQLERIRRALSETMGATVEVDSTIEPELIGGMSLRMGDRLLDGSLRGRIKRLAEAMHRH